MTTTVTIAVHGNKAVEVSLSDSQAPMTLLPGMAVVRCISGDTSISAREVGEFLPTGKLEWVEPTTLPAT